MSLLDTLGSLVGKSPEGGGQAALITAALEFVNSQPGGLNGLIQRFQEKALGEVASSWVSNGENQPIAADALHSGARFRRRRWARAKAACTIRSPGCSAQILPHVSTRPRRGEVPPKQAERTTVLARSAVCRRCSARARLSESGWRERRERLKRASTHRADR
nr:YidB family protein [Paraburkholderia graminis]